MRVAHVAIAARSDISAAWRIRQAQENAGVDAFALVHDGIPGQNVQLFRPAGRWTSLHRRLERRLDRVPVELASHRATGLPWSSGWTGYRASRRINEIGPDIVNVHWATNGTVDLRDLSRVKAPIVMTLHDVWPLTGGCHCNLGCDGWAAACRNCPQLGLGPFGIEIAHHLWSHKRESYSKIRDLTLVTPSRWLGRMAQQSALFRHRRVEVIPNCLDTELFRPVAKETVRKELALPSDRTILAFGALGGTDVVYKGYHLLLDALRVLKNSTKRDYHLVIFGSAGDTRQLPFPATFFGKLTDQRSLAAAFQCADLFVHPSQQDNFPGTVVEASACGVPVVAFDIGGIGDIVMHRTTGYLAQPFDVADLARGIELLTDGTLSAAEVGASARRHIVRYCSPHTVADRYIQLYQDLLVAEPLI